ncbi:site-specific integrase [Sphingobacterium siyangense]|uniref:site-specific integrase n=1 Tax=Sphingobacterium siyangense TaxID=459529 RepID=UPI0028A01D64|nr:site-specific integrase [Sphingobacterium siyangense]
MATVNAVVLEHQKKADGTWNVKYRVYHKGRPKYIDTVHYVSIRQLDKELKIKDKFLLKILEKRLDEYREAISDLGTRLQFFSPDDLKQYLKEYNQEVDFLQFAKEHIAQMREDSKKEGQKGKKKSASNLNTVRNSLMDFFRREKVSVNEINLPMLEAYDRFLRSARTITRHDQLGRAVTTVQKPLGDASVHNYMRDLRILFNEARKKFNIPSLGIEKITHNPFKEYSIVEPPPTKKRNVEIDCFFEIRDCRVKEGSRAELMKELFVLSFYMCGINAVDLFYCGPENIVNGRLEYNRSKTQGVRVDDAFISVDIIPEAQPLLQKYLGKLRVRYATNNNLNHALSEGMKVIRKTLKLDSTVLDDVTFYWARHTFGTWARNKCGVNKYDVGEALNHVEKGHKTTDIYIEKDWSIVDMVQRKVMEYVRKCDNKSIENAEIKTKSIFDAITLVPLTG